MKISYNSGINIFYSLFFLTVVYIGFMGATMDDGLDIENFYQENIGIELSTDKNNIIHTEIKNLHDGHLYLSPLSQLYVKSLHARLIGERS